jgi:hypothetical protein
MDPFTYPIIKRSDFSLMGKNALEDYSLIAFLADGLMTLKAALIDVSIRNTFSRIITP